MRGSHRRSRRRTRLLAINVTGLTLTLILALAQFGLAPAGASDRSRGGSYSSDTGVISTDKGDSGSSPAAGTSSGAVSTRTNTTPRPRNHGGPANPNITICHANASLQNLYNTQIVDANSIVTDPTGHTTHVGDPVGPFDPTVNYAGNKHWGDIIPPFVYDDANGVTQTYPGLNWTAQGQAIWNAGCQAVASLATPVKSAPASVAVGSTGNQFTISVTNNGANTANNVTVTDTVNAAFIVTAVTFTNPNGNGTCATSNNVNCNVGTLQPGQTAVVTITFSVSANVTCPGPITNQAAAAIGGGGSTNSNQTSTTITGCPPPGSPDMSVVKSGPATVSPGGGISYTLTVTNLGNATETNATVTDSLPANVQFVSASATNGWSSAFNPPTVTFSKASVPVGDSATLTINGTVSANAVCGSTITNTSTVAPGGTIAGNDSSTVTTTVVCPDLQITKSDGTTTVDQGGQTTYTITVQNAGTDAASNVTVTDVLPAGTTFVSATSPVGWTPTTPAVGANGTVTFTKASMAVNESATFTITVDVDPGAACGSQITNTATVSTSGTDSNPANNSASDTNTVVCPNVSIVKTGGPTGTVQTGVGGVALTYTVTISNSGAGAANATQIVDDLNDQLTNVQAVVNGNPPGQPTCGVGAGNVVTCGLFNLAPVNQANSSASITITATVPAGVCITVNNSATGTVNTGAGNQTSIGPSNTLTTTVTGCGVGPPVGSPAISISKTASPATVPAGDPVSYSITVTSFGTAPATNVTLSDSLPTIPGTTWSISSQPAGNPCSLAGNSLSCNFGTMNSPPQTTATVTVTSSNTDPNSCGTYKNTATASSTGLASVQASATATVECANAAGLDLNKTGPATAKVGDTVTYSFSVSLIPGSPDLPGVTITDPICDPGTLTGPTGDDGDNVLEAGETWGFSCTHLVTDSDPDPLPNSATACATGPAGTVCDSDNHEIDLMDPGIEVVKTADPISGSAGTVITFTYTVTNSGDVPLTNVSVDDNVLGHICDIALLPPHTTVTCTGTYVIPANASGTITNIVIAGGTDPAGDLVEDADDFTITVVAGATVTKTPPGGLAFTGQATAIPVAALALLLLTAGSALLWIGRRKARTERVDPAG